MTEGTPYYSIGYLGFMGIITGIHQNKNFSSILDAPTGNAFPFFLNSYSSYPFDLRFAMENYGSIHQISDYMKNRKYTYNHLIFLSDSKESFVLENNLNKNRSERTSASELNKGVHWQFKDALACVNSFLLKGNTDNHTQLELNFNRWLKISQFLQKNDKPLNPEKLKKLFTSFHGKTPGWPSQGDIYNKRTQQIVIFDSSNFSVEAFFTSPKGQPINPVFEKIEF